MSDKREVDKLEDNIKYKAKMEISYFCKKGSLLTGKFIKENIPFDVSQRQGIDAFFQEDRCVC
jgi:hypothetical protein